MTAKIESGLRLKGLTESQKPSFEYSDREAWFYQRGYRDAWNAAIEQAAAVAGRYVDSSELAKVEAAILGLKGKS